MAPWEVKGPPRHAATDLLPRLPRSPLRTSGSRRSTVSLERRGRAPQRPCPGDGRQPVGGLLPSWALGQGLPGEGRNRGGELGACHHPLTLAPLLPTSPARPRGPSGPGSPCEKTGPVSPGQPFDSRGGGDTLGLTAGRDETPCASSWPTCPSPAGSALTARPRALSPWCSAEGVLLPWPPADALWAPPVGTHLLTLGAVAARAALGSGVSSAPLQEMSGGLR